MKLNIRLSLSVMMFLQFFIWGAWYVTMVTYLLRLGFEGVQIGSAYTTVNWAAVISPFLLGMVADRFFAAEKVLGVLHIAGGFILWQVASITDPSLFFWVLLLYALCYMPTLALVNAVAMHQMSNPQKEFPGIRVLGTIGWIVAGLIIGATRQEDTSLPMKIAAGVSVAMGIYCFFLPHTPPKSAGKAFSVREALGLDALKLMREFSFGVFVISSLLVCVPLAFYYGWTNGFLNELGVKNAAGKMTMGQMSEIIFMLAMPLFFVRLGVKKMLLIGMAAWVVRYLFFALGNNDSLVPMLYLGILLHGICFDFFFVTGQIYIDQKSPPELRASAQGFIALVTYGAGMLIGTYFSGWIAQKYQIMGDVGGKLQVTGHHWPHIWIVPCVLAAIITVLFALLFHERRGVGSGAAPTAAGSRS